MTDTMTPEQRHRCMSHIRSRDTKPELKVRRWLWRHGYRYRIGVRSVPGKPDIVMRPYRTAIFVNGCFWHGHGVKLNHCETMPTGRVATEREQPGTSVATEWEQHNPSVATEREQPSPNEVATEREQPDSDGNIENSACCKIPHTNRSFWIEKIKRNQERDERNRMILEENGWQVIVVWECQLVPDKIEATMRRVELLLNEKMLSIYRHSPSSYTLSDEPLPLAAEEQPTFGKAETHTP